MEQRFDERYRGQLSPGVYPATSGPNGYPDSGNGYPMASGIPAGYHGGQSLNGGFSGYHQQPAYYHGNSLPPYNGYQDPRGNGLHYLGPQQHPVQHHQQLQHPAQQHGYLVTKQGPLGSSSQANAAASFYAKKHGKQQAATSGQQPKLQVADQYGTRSSSEDGGDIFKFNFRSIIVRAPPPLPQGLLARIEAAGSGDEAGAGKVRVVVRVASNSPLPILEDSSNANQSPKFFQVDAKRRQITLLDPTVTRHGGEIPIEDRKVGVAAPKMFAYDGIFSACDKQEDVASACLADVIANVMNGNDGCLFCFGHNNLGKTYSMLGEDKSTVSVGVIPTAIAWLYRVIKDKKSRSSVRFSIRISAVEIRQDERLTDLLADYASETDQSPGVYLHASQSSLLQNLAEVRASSVDKAAYYLDAALSNRSTDSQGRESHLLYTLHVYQYSNDKKAGVTGGRSRLHLLDLGGCDRSAGAGGITLSGLGNVILAIFNGSRHLPCRNSKVTGVLKECMGSLGCHATMLAHVSPEPAHYSETLHTLQLAARIHRMRRKRQKANSRTSGSSTSSDEGRRVGRFGKGGRTSGSSDFTTSTDPSSSEMSCATVMYLGHSDGSGTDGEHPPGLMRMKRRNLSGSRILTNGTISPRLSASPQPPLSSPSTSTTYLMGTSPRLTPTLPAIRESPSGKMPLNGKVPGYRQPPGEIWIDGDLAATAEPRRRMSPLGGHGGGHVLTNSSLNQALLGSTNNKEAAVGGNGPRRYGFMDDFKASMITHWVENQKDRSEKEAMFLTQFKQADSSDSGSEKQTLEHSSTKHHQHSTPQTSVRADVHPIPTSTSTNQTSASGMMPLTKQRPPPAPPRRSSSREKELGGGDSLQGVLMTSGREDMTKSGHQHDIVREKLNAIEPVKVDVDGEAEGGDGEVDGESRGVKLSPRGETEGSDYSGGPLPEPNFDQLFPSSLSGCGVYLRDKPSTYEDRFTSRPEDRLATRPEDKTLEEVPTYHSLPRSKDKIEDLASPASQGGLEQHPLRILSEENLTVVSTFVADLADLGDLDQEEADNMETASRLSFFKVPEYLTSEKDLQVADDKYFQNRLKELSKITAGQLPKLPSEASKLSQESSQISDKINENKRENYSKNDTKDIVNSINTRDEGDNDHDQLMTGDGPMSPQRQFQLLSQSIRRPDGSSNPDIDRVPPAKRSPGSGKSASDQEDDLPVPAAVGDIKPMTASIEEAAEPAPSPDTEPKKEQTSKKSSNISSIAMMLFRMFSSTRHKKNADRSDRKAKSGMDNKPRSKSCERELDSVGEVGHLDRAHRSSFRKLDKKTAKSASSSPLKRGAVGACVTSNMVAGSQNEKCSSVFTSPPGGVDLNAKNDKKKAANYTVKGNKSVKDNAHVGERLDTTSSIVGGGGEGGGMLQNHEYNHHQMRSSYSGLNTPPSMLSLVTTEWEFQQNNNAEEDDIANGNVEEDNEGVGERKLLDFSTFHSFGSVLKTTNSKTRERKSSGYDSLEGENSSLDSSGNGNHSAGSSSYDLGTYVYSLQHEPLTKPNFSDYNQVYAELDEITRLKMEIGRHPDLLNQNF